MGATVRHSTVESGGFVAAGSVIADNMVIKEGEVYFYHNIDLGWESWQIFKEHDPRRERNCEIAPIIDERFSLYP